MRALILFVIAVSLSGCATSGAAWISASQFDRSEYSHKTVAVMPVLQDELVAAHFPVAELQKALFEQLDILDIDKPRLVAPADAAEVSFPYTPARLAEFGRTHHYDAVVGVNVIRLDARPVTRAWSFTGTITFVDSTNTERTWTIAKTWSMFGTPGEDNVRLRLADALASDLFDVREVLRRGRTSVLLRRDTVVVDAGPALGLDAADLPREDSSRLVQILLNRPNRPSLKTSARELSVDTFAIDDKGIASLWLENGATRLPLLGDATNEKAAKVAQMQMQTEATGSSAPIFVAQRVGVPLVPGTNDIRLVSMNTEGQTVTRSLSIRNGKAAEVAHGSVSAAVIVASSFASLPGPAPKLLPQAQARVDALKSYGGASLDNGARAVVISGKDATRDTILRAVTGEWSRPALGTRRVLMFIGRAELAVGLPFLLMNDARRKHPENDSLSFDELRSLLKLDVSRIVVDVCTNESPPETLLAAMDHDRDKRLEITVSSDCAIPIGNLFLSADKEELQQ